MGREDPARADARRRELGECRPFPPPRLSPLAHLGPVTSLVAARIDLAGPGDWAVGNAWRRVGAARQRRSAASAGWARWPVSGGRGGGDDGGLPWLAADAGGDRTGNDPYSRARTTVAANRGGLRRGTRRWGCRRLAELALARPTGAPCIVRPNGGGPVCGTRRTAGRCCHLAGPSAGPS